MAIWLLDKCCIGPSRPGENPRYGHPCACPEGFLACVSESKNAELCGFSEFTDATANPPIEASVPPKKYRQSEYTGECRADFQSSRFKGEFTGEYVLSADCDVTQNSLVIKGLRSSTGSQVAQCSADAVFFGRDFQKRTYPLSATTQTLRVAFFFGGAWRDISFFWDQGAANCSDTGLQTLSDEDTENDAIDRVEETTEGASCTAIREERVDGFAFNYTTVKYEAILTGLIPKFYYDGVVPTEKRAAVRGETYKDSDWSGGTSIEIPKFRASKVFQLIGGGTLNVPDQDFIDENYSLDPLDYPGTFPVDESGDLVDPDAKVITPVTELIAESGEARRLLNPKITKWWSETERDRP